MGNQPLSDEALAGLQPEMRALVERKREELGAQIREFLKVMRGLAREVHDRLTAQDRDVAVHAAGGLVDDLVERYADEPDVVAYVSEVRAGVLADIALFRGHTPSPGAPTEPDMPDTPSREFQEREFRKYAVNVVVDNSGSTGAPVITERHPTYPNLVGRVEREALFGALVTDFTLISAGALHRANGGYLVLQVADLLRAPMAWDALRRALQAGAIDIEDVGDALGLRTLR